MKPMHVVQLGPVPPPEGGVSRNMVAIRDELVAQGHRCTLIATTSGGSDEDGVFRPRTPTALLKLLATLDFDILHLHIGGEVTSRVLGLALAASQFARGRSVLTLHSGAFPLSATAKNAKRFSFAGTVLRSFSRLIAVNEAIADVFARLGVNDENIEVIVPFTPKQPDPNVQIDTKFAMFSSDASPFLLSVGGLERDYEPLFLIESMPLILDSYPSARLMIVGDGTLRPDTESQISNYGLSDKVMLAGNITHEQVLHLIYRSDVLIRVTLFDGDAISVREALHLGTPVVATDNGMRPDGVQLLGEHTAAKLSVAIEAALNSEVTRPAEVSDGTERVLKIYEELFHRR
ncbi:MAG: glycosyltransferase family 4 protein [Blastocatellia bacterium]|nr:glycosyltransferase family 4 protein [Blastocatellia bacterium]